MEIFPVACCYGIGGLLDQRIQEAERPIAYNSRLLTKSEVNYSITEREGLALVWCLSKFQCFVWGCKVKLANDHQVLCFLMSEIDLAGRLACWILPLENLAPTRYKNSGKKGKKGKRLRGDSEEEKTPRKFSALLLVILSSPKHISTLQPKQASGSHRETILPSGTPASDYLLSADILPQEMSGPGKIEILRTDLDWPNIWREIAALPANIKETMFLFNQRLLPTTTRCHRFDSLTDENCQLCHQFPETDEHLVIYCPL
ncbi:Uncharacterized protein APZ42_025264 [Daphnia magna]|uniref:Reverse transcriptase RNase H-like domain-containing protein n=1 Tax=Daphnia magna TaxID=35525 RepID=A0A164TAK5_9CRUS|nr:Uncharacterized protein APZ42_025264 [Daphnia magna]